MTLFCAALLAGLAVVCPEAMAQSDAETAAIENAIDVAIDGIGKELEAQHRPEISSVAVYLLRGDADGYATTRLKSTITKSSLSLFTRDEEMLDKLFGEIEFDERKGEYIMDPETIQKFGKVAGVDAIAVGRVWGAGVNMWGMRAHSKISIQLGDVETGRVISIGPVQGEAYMHWTDAVTQFWRYPALLIGGIVALIVALLVLRAIVRGIKHATRPL